MVNRAVSEYAFAHARIRGRIGVMPDNTGWQKILNAGDLETTIETMATSGLAHWVKDYPRNPAPEEIERQCLLSLLGTCLFLQQHLPGRWTGVGRWLTRLPHVFQIRASLSSNADKRILLPGSPFLPVVSQPIAQRYAAIMESEYGVFLDDEQAPESRWVAQFYSLLPPMKGRESVVIEHIAQLLRTHYKPLSDPLPSDQVWVQRKALFRQLKRLLAGDPFHAGTILIYGLLESIQFERIRAILLLRAYQWPTSLLGGLV